MSVQSSVTKAVDFVQSFFVRDRAAECYRLLICADPSELDSFCQNIRKFAEPNFAVQTISTQDLITGTFHGYFDDATKRSTLLILPSAHATLNSCNLAVRLLGALQRCEAQMRAFGFSLVTIFNAPSPELLHNVIRNCIYLTINLIHLPQNNLAFPARNRAYLPLPQEIHQKCIDYILFPLIRPEVLLRFGVQPARGVLLCGPRGSGKKTLLRDLAKEAGATLFIRYPRDFFRSGAGESEESVRTLFRQAKTAARALVVLDDLPALFPRRDHGSEHQVNSLLSQFLYELDDLAQEAVPEVGSSSGSQQGDREGGVGLDMGRASVVVVGLARDPNDVPPQLRAAGRLHTRLDLPPLGPDERASLLARILRDHWETSSTSGAKPSLSFNGGKTVANTTGPASCSACDAQTRTICEQVAREAEGLAVADIVALVHAASRSALARTSPPRQDSSPVPHSGGKPMRHGDDTQVADRSGADAHSQGAVRPPSPSQRGFLDNSSGVVCDAHRASLPAGLTLTLHDFLQALGQPSFRSCAAGCGTATDSEG
eukprot:Rmarinus@m.14687